MRVEVDIKGMKKLTKALDKIDKVMDKELNVVLQGAGQMVEADAKVSIQTGPRTGRIYRRGNITHQASAPGEPPATDTGGLVNSISHWVDKKKKTVMVGTDSIVGQWLEIGTSRMEERPWLYPALLRQRKNIVRLFVKKLGDRLRKK